jgi:hypothetical protein
MEQFKFPDEIEVKNKEVEPQEDYEIEVVDDTPEEDRNRKPMEEPPKEVTDEELNKYDESVKKRIQHFTKGYHEERRAKEAAIREREEAVRAAQAIAEENRKLKGSLSEGQTALIEQAKKVVQNELEEAKRKYKTAYEAGDSEALISAQEEITNAKIKADKVNNFKPSSLQSTENQVQTQYQATDPKVVEWTQRNPWFGQNRKMTAYVMAVHEDLINNERISPTSDEYYHRIDTEMRERFPDAFESETLADAPTQRTRSNVVAPATRSTATKKIVLTKTQVQIAKKLGVPLDLYAKKVAEENRRNA